MITNRLHFLETEQTETVQERKKRLRAYMKERRANNENRDVKETLLVENFFKATQTLLGETTGAGAKPSVFCYRSFSSEAPTDKLLDALLENGYEVFCPRIEDGEMVAVAWGEDFTLSKLGIREPVGQAYTGETDIVVMPLLAVDERGVRLGYGGGFYDRYCKLHPCAKRIAYCFDFQLVKSVPQEDTDECVDCVVTDKRVVFFGRGNEVK